MAIKELTEEQKVIMEQVKNEWIERLFKYIPVNEDKAKKLINWLYKFAGYAEPREIIFAKSIYDAQLISNEKAETKNQFYPFSYFGNVGDYSWVSFYNFFEKIGVLSNPDFTQFKELLLTNIYNLIQFDELCVVSPKPHEIFLDDRNRLHNDSKAAVMWETDGYKQYFIHGVAIHDHRIVTNPELLKIEDIDKERNAEVRRVILEKFGYDRYIQESETVPIDSDDCGILYRKEIQDDEPLVMISVLNSTAEPDGSFKRYFLRVPPTVKTAKEAVAWTFELEEKDYSPDVES